MGGLGMSQKVDIANKICFTVSKIIVVKNEENFSFHAINVDEQNIRHSPPPTLPSARVGLVYCRQKGRYRQTSNISRTLVGNVSAAPTTSSFSASIDWAKSTSKRDEKHLSLGIWCDVNWRFDGTLICYFVSKQLTQKVHPNLTFSLKLFILAISFHFMYT